MALWDLFVILGDQGEGKMSACIFGTPEKRLVQ
jgi:hypothetical protein